MLTRAERKTFRKMALDSVHEGWASEEYPNTLMNYLKVFEELAKQGIIKQVETKKGLLVKKNIKRYVMVEQKEKD